MGLDPTIITAVISELEGSGQIGSESTRYEKIGYVTDAETSLEYSGDLVGLKVEDYCQGRRFAVADIPRPNLENNTVFAASGDDAQIVYSDNNGMLDKPALIMAGGAVGHLAPEAYAIDPRIDTVAYLYETTSDNIGLGLTLEKGWYALNLAKEILIPLDLSKTPVRFYDEVLTALFKEEYLPIMEQHFADKRETITYIVKPENVAEVYDADFSEADRTYWHTISPFNIAGLVNACMNPALLDFGASATYREGALRYPYGLAVMTTFYKPVTEVKPIDPKYRYPHFDLTAMGLPAVPVTGNTAYCTADIAALYEAMKGGFVRVTATADLGGMEVPISAGLACTVMETDTVHGAQGSAVVNFGGAPACLILVAEDGELSANILMLGGGSSINLPNAEEASF